MSKRSRQYFESLKEFNQLCEKYNIRSPPNQKRRKINNDIEHRTQTKQEIVNESLSPSPSPPQILLNKISNKHNTNNNTSETVTKIMNNISLKPPSPNNPKYIHRHICKSFNITPSNSNDKTKIFDGHTFYIANTGVKNKRSGVRKHWSDLNKNRCKLFNVLIPKHGGKIVENIKEFAIHHCDNHHLIIIVSEQIKRNDFDQLFNENMQQNDHYVFVTAEFITESLKHQNKLSLKQFKPSCLSQKHKQHQEQHTTCANIDIDRTDKYDKECKDEVIFACQIENDGHRVNHNSNITDIFDEMESIYGCLGDKWREFSYKKANGFIKKYPKKIKTQHDIKQLMKMKGFSKKLGDKVWQIVNTGQLRKLNELKTLPQISAMKLFTNIFGVGTVTAQKWYNIGLRTLDDVKNADKFNIKLQQRQILGLKYYDDLLIKIPRSEIRDIEKFIKNELNALCEECKCMICGSYRRGKLRSGDIDVLITHANVDKTDGLINKFVDRLHDIGFLVDHLSVPSGKDDHDTYMGICKLLDDEYKHYRHIDIKVYKPQHFAFAVLYFTGSDHFNRSMRYYAKQKGFTLSDTQLAPAIRIGNDKIFTFTQKAIQCKTEQDIFEALGLKYIKPTDRNTFENFGQSFSQNRDDNANDDDETTNVSSSP